MCSSMDHFILCYLCLYKSIYFEIVIIYIITSKLIVNFVKRNTVHFEGRKSFQSFIHTQLFDPLEADYEQDIIA